MKQKKISPVRIVFYLVLILILIYQIYPVIWMIITSFKSPEDVQNRSPFSLPKTKLGNSRPPFPIYRRRPSRLADSPSER